MAVSSSKKRKAPTLDTYFPPSPSATATSASPSRVSRSSATAPSTKVAKKKKAKLPTPIEFIHIDSDDSDIEILDPPPPPPPKLPRSRPASVAPHRAAKGKGKQREVKQETEPQPDAQQAEASNGAGDLDVAMRDDDEGGSSATSDQVQQVGEPAVGGIESATRVEESSRSETAEQESQWDDDEVVQAEAEGAAPLFRAETPEGEAELEEEWGEEPPMEVASEDDGEYEVPPVGEEGEEEEGDVVVQGSSKDLERPSKDDSACPVCAVVLSSLPESKRQAHVNVCLDGPKASTGGFFAPISSLFRSRADPSSAPASTSKPTPPISKPARRPLSFLPSFGISSGGTSAPNAFTALMTGHAENKQWKEAEAADKRKGRVAKGEQKAVPFYKWIEGLEVTVDAFRYNKIEGCKGYFLSHAHSDHYQNLSSSWSHGPIYCSLTTANLIKLKLKVKDEYIKVLPMDRTVKVEGIDVTLIDANHCPGSVLFLFEGPHTDPKSSYTRTQPKRIFRYLHCGDFRASPTHIHHPSMVGKRMDAIYLDTTYLDAKYCFPAQELVVNACAQLVKERVEGDLVALGRTGGADEERGRGMMKGWLGEGKAKKEEQDAEEEAERALLEAENEAEGVVKSEVDVKPVKKEKKKEKLLVLVGTYSIGKERIVKGIAQALSTKIYCDDKKLAILHAQDDPELHSLITRDPLEAQVHVCWLQEIKHDALADYLGKYSAGRMEGGFTKCIGLRPTGWTYRSESKEKTPAIAKILEREKTRKFSPAGMYPQRDSTSTCLAYGVPYSEHSSFYELTCFALSLDYGKIIPTVNVHTTASRDKMKEWMTRWVQEKKRRQAAKMPKEVPSRADTYW